MKLTMLLIHLLLLSLLIHEAQGRAIKLINTSPIPTTTTIHKNDKYEKKKQETATKEENLSVNSSSITETYPDILDIAGMDYSQARRKPPIHN